MADGVNMNLRQLHWQKHIRWILWQGFYVWFAKLSVTSDFSLKSPLFTCLFKHNLGVKTQWRDLEWQWEEGNNPENVMTSSNVWANAWIIINAVCYSRKSWCLTLMEGEAKHCKAALDNHTVQQEMTRSKASDTWTQSFIAAPGWTKLLFTLKHYRHTGNQS